MISDRELWACALQVLQQHRARTDTFLAERVTALAAAQDDEGVKTWRAIAERVDQLRDTAGMTRLRH